MLPYLAGCAALGHQITVLSCEKPQRLAQDGARIADLCRQAGLEWHPLTYHRRPPVLSSIYDAVMLTRTARRLNRSRRFDVVHCRSYVPGIAGLKLRREGVRLIFDMRGFWPEERTEGGSWRLSNPLFRTVYRYFKRLESRLLSCAEAIVSLTEAAKRQLLTRPELARGGNIAVIPCSVDFDHFPLAGSLREDARRRLGLGEATPVLAYLGSLGGNYMLDEMLDFFRCFAARNPGAVFLFVTMDPAAPIRAAAAAKGIGEDQLIITAASRDDVPKLIAAADAGVAFKQPSFSALACSPTKIGEMLAMGIPVVANAGVGDVETLLQSTGSGVVVDQFTDASYGAAAEALRDFHGSPEQIRSRAREVLDAETAVGRYAAIYDELGALRGAR